MGNSEQLKQIIATLGHILAKLDDNERLITNRFRDIELRLDRIETMTKHINWKVSA